MAMLFVGPSKLLSNVQNVICVLKWDMTMPEKAISKGKYKKSYVLFAKHDPTEKI